MCISVVFLQIISGDTAEKLVSRSVQLGACTCIQYKGEVLYIFGKSLNSHSGYGSFYIHKSVIATLIWCAFMHTILQYVPCNDSKGIWHNKTASSLFVAKVIK